MVEDSKCAYVLLSNDLVDDDSRAVEIIRKHAAQGHAPMQLWIGTCYADGIGVPKDPAEAVKWYRKAAEQGDAKAKESLRKLGVK